MRITSIYGKYKSKRVVKLTWYLTKLISFIAVVTTIYQFTNDMEMFSPIFFVFTAWFTVSTVLIVTSSKLMAHIASHKYVQSIRMANLLRRVSTKPYLVFLSTFGLFILTQ